MEAAKHSPVSPAEVPALSRATGSTLRELLAQPELAILGALLALTGAFGRGFSTLELGFAWLHPTEVLIALALAIVLVRDGPGASIRRVRETGALIPLLVLWMFGAIAAIRGLNIWGFDLVLHDIGLVEYSVCIPLVAVSVRDRSGLVFACRAVALGGALAIVVFAASIWGPWAEEVADAVDPIAVASGLYIALFAVWIASGVAVSGRTNPFELLLLAAGVMLIVYGIARAAWAAILIGLSLAVILAPSGRRIRTLGIVGSVVLVGVLASIPIQASQEPPAASINGVSESSQGGADGGGSEGPAVVSELAASFGGVGTEQGANASWRLAFWGSMLEDSARAPLFGAGFGRPANFEWRDVVYDSRDEGVDDLYDVTGPHNSFVAIIYRAGWPAFIALLAIGFIALRRLVPIATGATGENRRLGIWLLSGLAVTTVVASFSVALEGPYMGIFFWTLLGLALVAPRLLEGSGKDPAQSNV